MKFFVLFLTMLSVALGYNYHGCAFAPDNVHGWVVTIDTALVFHTSDGGVNWHQQEIPANSKKIFDVTCINELRAWTCGILGEILHTENGGIDWVQDVLGLSKYATRIEFLDDSYGWAACGDGVVARTTDAGSFWEQNFTPWYGAEYYGVSFVNQWDGWIVAGWPDSLDTGQGFIARSTDGGINWDSLYMSPTYEDFLDVFFFNLFEGIVVGGDEQTHNPIILKTTDSGVSWNPITAPGGAHYLRAVDFVDNRGWAVGKQGTIIYTSNYGDTWSYQTNPAESTLFDVDFSDSLHGLCCGYDGILYTTDGGQNWSITSGLQEEHENMPTEISFLHVFPNPFREKTDIRYQITDNRSQITDNSLQLKIYDATGRVVKDFSQQLSDISYPISVITWDGTDDNGKKVSCGIYLLTVESENYRDVTTIVFLE
jgi:photosystem II stability/assembly factor-like uncharacterized protein